MAKNASKIAQKAATQLLQGRTTIIVNTSMKELIKTINDSL